MTARKVQSEHIAIRCVSTLKKQSIRRRPTVRFTVVVNNATKSLREEDESATCPSLENERKAMLYKQANCVSTSNVQRRMVANYVNTVLEEQLSQWENSSYDPERLAMISMAKSLDCQVEAVLRGRKQEIDL